MTLRAIALVSVLLVSLPATTCYAQLQFQFTRDTIDFGNVSPCAIVLDSFEMVNTGAEVFAAPDSTSINGFVITTRNASNILPGQRRWYYVQFNGTTARPFYRSFHIITLTINGEVASDTILLLGARLAGRCCVFIVDSTQAFAGERVIVDVLQDSTPPLANLSNVVITFQIGYDPTTLVPDGRAQGEIARERGKITVRTPLLAANGPIASLPFRATLGRLERTPVEILWYSLTSAELDEKTYPGTFTLLGACTDGGRFRGFDAAGLPSVSIRSVVGGLLITSSTAEETVVKVHDLSGRVVARQTCGEANTSYFVELGGGLYVCSHSMGVRPTIHFVE